MQYSSSFHLPCISPYIFPYISPYISPMHTACSTLKMFDQHMRYSSILMLVKSLQMFPKRYTTKWLWDDHTLSKIWLMVKFIMSVKMHKFMKCHKIYYLFLIPYSLFSYLIIFWDDPKPLLSCVIFITYLIFSSIKYAHLWEKGLMLLPLIYNV